MYCQSFLKQNSFPSCTLKLALEGVLFLCRLAGLWVYHTVLPWRTWLSTKDRVQGSPIRPFDGAESPCSHGHTMTFVELNILLLLTNKVLDIERQVPRQLRDHPRKRDIRD